MDAMDLKELTIDVQEFRQFLSEAKSERVKNILIEQIRLLEEKIAIATKKQKSAQKAEHVVTRTYDINTYAWDQSDNFVKLYLTVSGVENVQAENVKCSFSSRSASVIVLNLNSSNHEFTVKNLLHDILPEDSIFKLKKDSLLLMLRKKTSTSWKYLTTTEQQLQESKDGKWKPKAAEESKDPGDSLMDLMRHMYESGDDDLKRTIAKAWTESRDKQGAGAGFGGF